MAFGQGLVPPRPPATEFDEDNDMNNGPLVHKISLAWALRSAALAAGAWLTACAAPEPAADIDTMLAERGLRRAEPINEIRNYRISGWNSLDDKHLIVRSGPRNDYLITLMTRCQPLDTSETIGFSTTTGDVTRFDELVVSGPGGIVEDCPITAIENLEPIR